MQTTDQRARHSIAEERTVTSEIDFEFKGLDHVALVVKDMKETVAFYNGVLGMPVLHTLEYVDDDGNLTGQHWFFGVGDPSNPEAHLAMFWWKDGYQSLPAVETEPIKPKNPMATPIGSMIHLNLRVDADKIEAYCAKLAAHGVPFRHAVRYFQPDRPRVMRAVNTFDEYHSPGEGALMSSVYITDPSGIQIEFNAWLPGWESWPNDDVAVADADV